MLALDALYPGELPPCIPTEFEWIISRHVALNVLLQLSKAHLHVIIHCLDLGIIVVVFIMINQVLIEGRPHFLRGTLEYVAIVVQREGTPHSAGAQHPEPKDPRFPIDVSLLGVQPPLVGAGGRLLVGDVRGSRLFVVGIAAIILLWLKLFPLFFEFTTLPLLWIV